MRSATRRFGPSSGFKRSQLNQNSSIIFFSDYCHKAVFGSVTPRGPQSCIWKARAWFISELRHLGALGDWRGFEENGTARLIRHLQRGLRQHVVICTWCLHQGRHIFQTYRLGPVQVKFYLHTNYKGTLSLQKTLECRIEGESVWARRHFSTRKLGVSFFPIQSFPQEGRKRRREKAFPRKKDPWKLMKHALLYEFKWNKVQTAISCVTVNTVRG